LGRARARERVVQTLGDVTPVAPHTPHDHNTIDLLEQRKRIGDRRQRRRAITIRSYVERACASRPSIALADLRSVSISSAGLGGNAAPATSTSKECVRDPSPEGESNASVRVASASDTAPIKTSDRPLPAGIPSC
jgi:hypothetical protein